jgi:hypothetical protein
MPTQRNLPPRGGQVTDSIAAMQRVFPRAVIRHNKIARNPNRSSSLWENVFTLPLLEDQKTDVADCLVINQMGLPN